MSEKPTRVVLVRHGLNDWVGKRLAGWTAGVHLNERGREQAEATGERLAGVSIAAIYSSPLERAQETAASIATRHPGLEVRSVEGLGEAHIGDWTGQSIEDLAKTDLWRQVQFAPSVFRFPNGESMAETQIRMVSSIETLRAAHPGETIVLVSHSDPIKLAVAYYLGMPLDLFQRLSVSPASITEIAVSMFGGYLLRLNETGHLPPEPEEEQKTEEVAAAGGQPVEGNGAAAPASENQRCESEADASETKERGEC